MTAVVVGIDVGTSGVRAVAMDPGFAIQAQAGVALADFGTDWRDPATWWRAVETAIDALLRLVDARNVRALAVDGTSGTMLPVDAAGGPLGRALMYSDKVDDATILSAIADDAPPQSAAHGATSGLAKLLRFQKGVRPARVLHQADWIAGRFCGRFDVSDENNALKTGYDPVRRGWPDWLARTGADLALLPDVVAPGKPFGTISPGSAQRFGLPGDVAVVAGTTDGCASFLATGADRIGDAVTALGSSLTLKLLCEKPLFAPQFGIYSHRIGDAWLAGGASNTGGKVLAHFFPLERIVKLSESIDPDRPTGLDYYPLIGTGERFPIADAGLAPRLDPRPADDALFLQAMLEGIAAIERRGYRQLADLGGPALRSVRSVGGGARNPVWTAIRARQLRVPFFEALSEEAAAGTARLALQGARTAGLL
ncbi:MAG: carbohydrate kinase [Mesorhizobium sp.]|uniref:FGGY-family carbohydrate kinase n=1 Tax=Mesorhizobium sp. TaxID=1871066 RepID=UPI000FD324B8|nr:FGGY-family carbohydrate kinase [Mesorhizobium sp.]RVC80969.1 carbohydrate kinase [Mesorhizobium sp. M2A.F.Ca.ET.046.02.1.1]RWB45017.1 MAG: carbohydrate kinase [Mesorhizobium sp.]